MKTSSASSVLPFSGPAQSDNTPNAPQSDDSSSFHDVMQQQNGNSSNNSNSNSTSTSSNNSSTSNTPTTTATQTTKPASTTNTTNDTSATAKTPATPTTKTETTTSSATSDLSAMLVRIAALAANAKDASSTSATATDSKDAKTTAPSAKDSKPTAASITDLTTLIAQAFVAVSAAAPAPTTPTTPTTPAKTATSDPTKDGPATPAAATVPDVSTLIAQASILASTAQATTATAAAASTAAGKDLPIVGSVKAATVGATKEKKSSSSEDQGTFLQAGTDASSSVSNLLGMLGIASQQGNQSPGGEQLGTGANAKKSPLEALQGLAASTGGTANVEKKAAMNTDLNIPQTLTGTPGNTVALANNSDMQIKLSSNNDFTDALKQVMHVASLTQTAESRTPMRVAIEIQTPPGAVVNVYVSKQNDQYRAQLSTNDPVALAWVQDKVTALKSSDDMGVSVRWLPPQMESISTSNTSSDANLGWDRGGQGQGQYQQDERQQNRQQQDQADDAPSFASIGSKFMKNLTPAGSAA